MNLSDKKKVFVFLKAPIAGGGTLINSLLKIKSNRFDLSFFSYERVSNPSIISQRLTYLNEALPSSPKLNLFKFLSFFKSLVATYVLLKKEKTIIAIPLNFYSFVLIKTVSFFVPTRIITVFRVGDNIYGHLSSKPGLVYRKFLLLLASYLIRQNKYFIFVSREIYSNFKRKFRVADFVKFSIIHNGIDLSLVQKLSVKPLTIKERTLFASGSLKIISAGRFEHQKDFSSIIEAFNIVSKSIPSVSLFLIGDGSLKKQLVDYVKKIGLQDSIFFLGWKKNIFPYLKRSDLFIYSSKHEGFGYVILEALSQKLPVLATKTPYTPSEILGYGKYGVLLPVGDHKTMAKEIINILINKKVRKKYQLLSYQRAKYFSEKKMLYKYSHFLIYLLNHEI